MSVFLGPSFPTTGGQRTNEGPHALDPTLFDLSTHPPPGMDMNLEGDGEVFGRTMYEEDMYQYSDDGVFTPLNELYSFVDGSSINLSYYDISQANFLPTGPEDTFPVSENGTVTVVPQSSPISYGRVVALAIFTMFFLVGIVGNALVIGTTAKFGTMRKVVTYLYLVNLSVANLLFLLVCLPTSTASYVLVDWPFGQTFCHVEKYVMSISMSVSVLTITATGLDRYLAIVYPVWSKRYRTTGKTLFIIGSIWVLSLALMIPRMLLFKVRSVFHIVGWIKLCEREANARTLKIDTTLTCVFLYVLPLVVLVICHVRIGQTIWKGGRIGLRGDRPYQGGVFGIRERRRIAKIVIAITIVFGIGWLPIHLYNLVEDFDNGNVLLGEFLERGTVALFFSFGANALNPLIYCVISGTYRKHIMNTFLCRKTMMINRSVMETRVEVSSYRRAAPILQPRPALILPSQQRTQAELNRRLLEPHSSDLFNSATSVEELSAIRVSDIDQISTSSLGKNILVPPSSYIMKKEADVTSSLLKTTSPSLILTDLEISEDHDKENIDTTTQSRHIVLKSSEERNSRREYNDQTLCSTKEINSALGLPTFDLRNYHKRCESKSSNFNDKDSTHPHRINKLQVKFPHTLKNATKSLHDSRHAISANLASSSLSLFPSTSSTKFHSRIESHELKTIDTNEIKNIQSRKVLQTQHNISSNLQPKKQRLIQIKSFSKSNGADTVEYSNNPLCDSHKSNNDIEESTPFSNSNSKQISVGMMPTTEQRHRQSKILPLPKIISSLHSRESSDVPGKIDYKPVKDIDDTENDAMILSKPIVHKHKVVQDKSTPSKQRLNSRYNSQKD